MALPLSIMINTSIESGHLPNTMKLANVIPNVEQLSANFTSTGTAYIFENSRKSYLSKVI